MKTHLTIHKDDKEYNYTSNENLSEWLAHKIRVHGWADGKVYLISIHNENEEPHTTEIFITESVPMARYFVEDWFMTYEDVGDIIAHVMECDSYEDAYATALGMREIQPNCYDKEAP